jgi:hypothetical protein
MQALILSAKNKNQTAFCRILRNETKLLGRKIFHSSLLCLSNGLSQFATTWLLGKALSHPSLLCLSNKPAQSFQALLEALEKHLALAFVTDSIACVIAIRV